MSEKTSFFKIGAGACFPVAVCRHGDIRQPRESRPLFALGRLEQIDFAALDLAVHVGQLGDYRRDEFERVGDGRLFALALDAIEHGGVQGPEAQLRVVHARIAQHGAQARQFGFETGGTPKRPFIASVI